MLIQNAAAAFSHRFKSFPLSNHAFTGVWWFKTSLGARPFMCSFPSYAVCVKHAPFRPVSFCLDRGCFIIYFPPCYALMRLPALPLELTNAGFLGQIFYSTPNQAHSHLCTIANHSISPLLHYALHMPAGRRCSARPTSAGQERATSGGGH